MIVDRPESWYLFILKSDYFETSDNGPSYMVYEGKRLTNKEYLDHWGKWVFFGEKAELDEMARNLDPYVESGAIPCIKYDRAPQEWASMEQCVMCVYCDDRQREDVHKILRNFGVKAKGWAPEQEVIKKWSPGGLHLERWIKSKKLSDDEAKKVREDAHERFNRQFFDRLDAICLGWQQ